jgi:hypothetical protein
MNRQVSKFKIRGTAFEVLNSSKIIKSKDMNSEQPVKTFKDYAESQLNKHLSELRTRYENESPGSETLKKGYEDHKTIYSKELDQKINDLSKDNAGAQSQLDELKKNYVNKLSASSSSK